MVNTYGLKMPNDIRSGVMRMSGYITKAKADISELPGCSMREIERILSTAEKEIQKVLDNNFEYCNGR